MYVHLYFFFIKKPTRFEIDEKGCFRFCFLFEKINQHCLKYAPDIQQQNQQKQNNNNNNQNDDEINKVRQKKKIFFLKVVLVCCLFCLNYRILT